MTSKEMGDIIFRLKHQKNIQKDQLYLGICSRSALFRFETGEATLDYLTLKYILSRLGKSINKVDYMLGSDDFEFLTFHSTITDFLLEDDLDSAEELLNEYTESVQTPTPVLSQCLQKLQCILLEKRGTSPAHIVSKISSALRITLCDFTLDRLPEYLLSEDEWLLLFMLLEQIIDKGDANASPQVRSIYHYFNTLEFDQEAWIMLYPKISWLYMKVCDSIEERISICDKVLLALRENTRLLHMDCFVKTKCDLYKEKYGASHPEYVHVQKQYDALLWVYEDAGKSISTKPEIWFSINNPEIYLLPEVVRSERKILHFSQEKAGDKFDIDQKTFSRIENGVNNPKPGTLAKIKETLGIYRGIHNTLLVVNDFEDLELQNQISRAISKHDYSLAQTLLDELTPRLSLEHKENAQYVMFSQTLIDFHLQRIDTKETFERCVSAFEITRPYNEASFDKLILSRTECNILHLISYLYEEKGDFEHSISLLESIIRGFSLSKVNPKVHYRELSLILLSLSYIHTSQQNFSNALSYANRGLNLQFNFYRCNMIHLFLTQKYYITGYQTPVSRSIKDAYRKIYLSEELFLNSKDVALANYFRIQFDEDITNYS